MKKILPKLNLSKVLTLFVFLMSYTLGVNAQTELITASDGGFENATTTFAANGWTVVNDATNAYYVGTAAFNGGTYGAYISTDGGTTNDYNNGTSQVSHFYRDIVFPAGESIITLEFDWKCDGESGYDNLQVFLVETTTTPVAGTKLISVQRIGSSYYSEEITWQVDEQITIDGANAGTTKRLVFSWINDGSVGQNPPVATDNISLTSMTPPDATSIVEDPTSQVTAGNILSIADTEGEAVDVFSFKITDDNIVDIHDTKVTKIRVTPGGSNTADWTDNIAGVTLNGGAITIGTPTINDSYIDIPITSGNLDVPGGSSLDVIMAIYLTDAGNVADGDIFEFFIDGASHGWTADGTGSTFAADFGANVTSNLFTIVVEATKLTFTTEPSSSVYINTNLDTPPVVTAYDANDNIDLDFTETVTLTNSGLIAMTGNSMSAVAGLADFATLQFTAPGGPLTLTANSGAVTDAVTAGTITVNNAPVVVWSEDFEGDVSAWTFGTTGQTNKWEHGTAEFNGGANSAYVSNDGGTTAAYTNGTTSTSWLETTVDLSSSSEASLSFWWKCEGEGGYTKYDYGEVYINDNSVGEKYNQNSTWTQESIDISSYVGSIVTLKFKWVNDGSSGSNPPLCIDDIEISAPAPADMAYASSTVTQENADLIIAGDINNEIVGIQVVTNNTANPLSITNFSVNATGTTDIND
ncbi:MAG: hypothetical protein KAQ75_07265, partial [Bacteroidales bacterium]|nr:hypothetical protein [Bacteroidales bacterium]